MVETQDIIKTSRRTVLIRTGYFTPIHFYSFVRLTMFFFALASLAISSLALAAPKQAPTLAKRCINSAEDRSCWGDYDLSTDYYDTDAVPDTGVVREYWFDVQNGTAAPDGIERIVLTVNGSYPGPTIIADWGDTVVVHVTNSMVRKSTKFTGPANPC